MTQQNAPTLEEWRRLYEVALHVKEVAPWEWMTETWVFGVQSSETAEIGFVSVMGMLGEHYAVALYLGAQGLYQFWGFEDQADEAPVESLLQIPHLQASFQDRNDLSQRDRDVIKSLGLKFRGRKAWPMFRSYRPGFAPWFLEAAEVRFLTEALEQLPDVAVRFREDPTLLEAPDDESYLVRVPRPIDDTFAWEDQVIRVPLPKPLSIRPVMDFQALETVKRSAQYSMNLEVDFFQFPVAFQEERGARPAYSYNLLLVEPQHGFILGHDFVPATPDIEAMWGSVPARLLAILARLKTRPAEIRVSSDLLFQLLQPLAEELHFPLRHVRWLPTLERVKRELLSRFR